MLSPESSPETFVTELLKSSKDIPSRMIAACAKTTTNPPAAWILQQSIPEEVRKRDAGICEKMGVSPDASLFMRLRAWMESDKQHPPPGIHSAQFLATKWEEHLEPKDWKKASANCIRTTAALLPKAPRFWFAFARSTWMPTEEPGILTSDPNAKQGDPLDPRARYATRIAAAQHLDPNLSANIAMLVLLANLTAKPTTYPIEILAQIITRHADGCYRHPRMDDIERTKKTLRIASEIKIELPLHGEPTMLPLMELTDDTIIAQPKWVRQPTTRKPDGKPARHGFAATNAFYPLHDTQVSNAQSCG